MFLEITQVTPLVFFVVEGAAVAVAVAVAVAATATVMVVAIVPISDRSAMNVCSRGHFGNIMDFPCEMTGWFLRGLDLERK
jgi:hypothetical protein